jgi:hypothetical protein
MANKKPRKERPPLTQRELEDFWRDLKGGPGFIGPIGPPMWLWMHDREKQKAWAEKHGLRPREDKE